MYDSKIKAHVDMGIGHVNKGTPIHPIDLQKIRSGMMKIVDVVRKKID